MPEDDEWVDGENVWPDNHLVWEVWWRVSCTQWHTVIAGKSILYQRLDYSAVWKQMKALGIKKKSRGEIFLGVQEMELAALPVLNGSNA